MALVSTDSRSYSDIAGAIRTKLNVETTYKPREMAAAILRIGEGEHGQRGYAGSLLAFGGLQTVWSASAYEVEE